MKFYNLLRPRNNGESTGRKPGPYKWFEIQDNVAYYNDFEKPKIAWGNLALKGQFALVEPGFYINAPSAFIATDYSYLAGILNSKLADFYIKQLGVTRNGGYFEYKPMFVEKLPIPVVPQAIQAKLMLLIEFLIENYELDDDVNKLKEATLNDIIFELYGLDNDERKTILES